jgi:WD40 repeat protein
MRQAACLLLCASVLAGCDGSAYSPQRWLALTEQSGAYSIDISHGGRHALVGAVTHGGSLWNLDSEARLFDWNHLPGQFSVLSAVDFSPDGRYALTANPQDLVLWSVDTGMAEGFWSAPGEILAAELSSGGSYALLGLANHEAVYFDIRNGGVRSSLRHPARVRSVALSGDERRALTGSDDYTARFWDLDTAQVLQQITLGNTVDTVALSPNGRFAFSSGSLDQALVWDTSSGEPLFHLSGDETLFPRRLSYLSARFSDNSDRLLVGRADGTVELWDVNAGELIKRWKGHKRAAYGPTSTGIIALAFGADGNSWLAAGSNGIINWLR